MSKLICTFSKGTDRQLFLLYIGPKADLACPGDIGNAVSLNLIRIL
jgi:hypothetical protein